MGLVKDVELRGRHYHLDHIYSVFDGFFNQIPYNVIAHWTNLRVIPAKDNFEKLSKSHVTKEELFRKYYASTMA